MDVSIENLQKRYGKVLALDDVSLRISGGMFAIEVRAARPRPGGHFGL
jgi:hypothetical protein